MNNDFNLIGLQKNMLTIQAVEKKNRRTRVYVLCECGNQKWMRLDVFRDNRTHSCGCYNRDNNHWLQTDITGKNSENL